MKKQFSEINGLLLSNKQMKTIKGGRDKKKPCGTFCTIPDHPNYGCAPIAIGGCYCRGEYGIMICH
ncbi:MAG: hypothetical protein V1781_00430 [Bacteroidota bacterium]